MQTPTNGLSQTAIAEMVAARDEYGFMPEDYAKLRQHMTNWQRHQWAKAGYKPYLVPKYATMLKPVFR